MKTRIITILMFAGLQIGYAQQEGSYSQYMFNGFILNPAYAGSKPYISAAALLRKQWVDFPGSPLSQSLYIHGPLPNRRVGLGLSLVNDHIGVSNTTSLYGSYAYHVHLGKGNISMGLQGGVSYYSAKLSELKIWDTKDEVFDYDRKVSMVPNVGAGVYYYATKFYMGVSTPHILNNNFEPNSYIDNATHEIRHFYITSGYVLELSREVKLKPSFLIKYVEGAPVQTDLNLNILLDNIIWVGGSYRTGDSFVGIFEFQVTNRIRIGYAYDAALTLIRTYSSGSHEIMIGFDFGYDILKMKTPRYF